jgi:ankyrin repeat protein
MLSWTASVGHLQLAKLLLNSDQIDLATEGPLALCYAAEQGQVLMLNMLLDDFHLNANSTDHMGRTPLIRAAARAQTEVVRLLIHKYHVDPMAMDNLGRTPLSWAAANGSQDVLRINNILDTVRIFLDSSEVDPDSEDAMGRTPLACAVRASCEPVVKLLLNTGRTDPSLRFDGHPLVAWAFEFKRSSIAKLLIDKGVPDWGIKTQRDWEHFRASGLAGHFDFDFWSDVLCDELEESGHPLRIPTFGTIPYSTYIQVLVSATIIGFLAVSLTIIRFLAVSLTKGVGRLFQQL